MKKLLYLIAALLMQPLCGQVRILEIDVIVTDPDDGFLGLAEVTTVPPTNTIARVKGHTTPGDGLGADYRWTGTVWEKVPVPPTTTPAELAAAVAAETARAQTAENEINADLTALGGAISAETARALAAEAGLQPSLRGLTEDEKLIARDDLGIADFPSVGRFDLPFSVNRLKNFDLGSINAGTPNHYTLLTLGDSMGHRLHAPLRSILENHLGRAGLAFEELRFNVVSGSSVLPTANDVRRPDAWGSGDVSRFENGAVVEIGAPLNVVNAQAFTATDLSLYLVAEAGGGTFDLDQSLDNGATWTSLESAISTNAATLSPLVKRYSFSERSVMFRMTVTSGGVECIGGCLRNFNHKGLVSGFSAVGGNPTENQANANQAIFDAVMADYAPDCVIYHAREGTSTDPSYVFPSTFAADMNAIADNIVSARSELDVVIIAEHETVLDSDLFNTRNNSVFRDIATRIPQVKLWEADQVFGGFAGLSTLGWNDPDAVHLDDEAWRFQAAELSKSLNLQALTKSPRWVSEFKNQSLDFFNLSGVPGGVTTIFQTGVDNSAEHAIRMAWDDPDSPTTLDENYWQFARLRASDPVAPNGYEVLVKDGTVANAVTVTDRSGRTYAGAYNSTTVPPNFSARYFAREAVTSIYCFGARHTQPRGYLFRGFQGNDDSNPTFGVRGDGTVESTSQDVSDWPTLADEAAADAAGIPVFSSYKTPNGELRYRLN